MKLGELFTIALVAATALLGLETAGAGTRPQAEADIQMLGSFPALQRLAQTNEGALRRSLGRIARAYAEAGYANFGTALPAATPLIRLFDDRKPAGDGALKRARAILRRLEAALAADGNVSVAADADGRTPDYQAIAATFLKNSARALQNLAAGRNVANFLRKTGGPLWLESDADLSPPASVGGAGVVDTSSLSVSFSKSGPGAVTLSGGTTFTGATFVISGTLTFSGGFLSLASADEGYRWILFPPGTPIPADLLVSGTLAFSADYTAGSTFYPAGTRLVRVTSDTPLPEGAAEIDPPVTFALPTPTPSPSPSPSE